MKVVKIRFALLFSLGLSLAFSEEKTEVNDSERKVIVYLIEDAKFLGTFGDNWYEVNRVDKNTSVRIGIRGMIAAAGVEIRKGDSYIYKPNFGGVAILLISAQQAQHDQFRVGHLRLLGKAIVPISEKEYERRKKIIEEKREAAKSEGNESDPFSF